jgi:hypothetical protein
MADHVSPALATALPASPVALEVPVPATSLTADKTAQDSGGAMDRFRTAGACLHLTTLRRLGAPATPSNDDRREAGADRT